MRLLIVIPHYYHAGPSGGTHGSSVDKIEFRQRALRECIWAIHQMLGRPQCIMHHRDWKTQAANQSTACHVDIVVCTTGEDHLLNRVDEVASVVKHVPVDCSPPELGFSCYPILSNQLGRYDWYGYMEDDLILHDPWFISKLAWFQSFAGPQAVMLPNRYERGFTPLAAKAYVDGDLADRVTEPFQNVSEHPILEEVVMGQSIPLRRAANPHSGCWFVSAEQLEFWSRCPDFLSRDTSFIGPLESAASLGLMKTFRVYKPVPEVAGFFEIEHFGRRFISQLRRPDAKGHT